MRYNKVVNIYILRWNPNISSFKRDAFNELFSAMSTSEALKMNWSIYDYGKLSAGDFFIMQQVGTSFDGVVTFGRFISNPYLDETWKKGVSNVKLFYADIAFSFVVNRWSNGAPLDAKNYESEFPDIEFHHGHSGVIIPSTSGEAFITKMIAELFLYNEPCESVAFGDVGVLRQTLCNYLNVYCPNTKSAIISANIEHLKNNKSISAPDIDIGVLPLTYNKAALKAQQKKGVITSDDLKNFITVKL